MSGKGSSSLKELKDLREAVLAEEKARTQALLQNLPESQANSSVVEENPEIVSVVEEMPTDEAVTEIPAPPPPPPSPKKPAISPVASRPPGAPPPGPLPNKAKPPAPKEPALIIPLTPKIQERLQRNVENARWSPAELVMELIRVSLHRGYPAIEFGNQTIAKAGTYRTLERNPFEAVLKITSGQGVFSISVREDNAEFQHWLAYFQGQEVANPEKSASQVCLFSLQSYLENVEDFRVDAWAKTIPVDAYTLSPA